MTFRTSNMNKKTPNTTNRRSGISLVEVLTSIVIALIGVAGVLVLIPFGIRQAEIGLDIDDAITMGDNALAQFEIIGYRRVDADGFLPWINIDNAPFMDPDPACAGLVPAAQGEHLVNINCPTDTCYFIDPLWTGANTAVGSTFPGNNFFDNLFVDQLSLPPAVINLLPESVALVDAANPVNASNSNLFNPLPFGLAARMFLNSDDLQFATDSNPVTGLPLDEIAPPLPFLDLDGTGAVLRRQARGELSWSAIAVPSFSYEATTNTTSALDTMEFYTLIYKDRNFADPSGTFSDVDFDPRYRVATIADMTINGGDFRSGGTVAINAPIAVSNDDWVMMANFHPDTGTYQAGFYRVTGSNPEADPASISLDGPAFTFDPNGTNIIIHLTKVLNVYRRTILLERDSIFNQ